MEVPSGEGRLHWQIGIFLPSMFSFSLVIVIGLSLVTVCYVLAVGPVFFEGSIPKAVVPSLYYPWFLCNVKSKFSADRVADGLGDSSKSGRWVTCSGGDSLGRAKFS